MSWADLDLATRQLAQATLTPKQLDVWKLELAGVTAYRMELMLDTSRSNIREHLRAARRNLFRAGLRQDDNGNWRIEEAA
jgi:transcriptional regulator